MDGMAAISTASQSIGEALRESTESAMMEMLLFQNN